MHPAWNPRAVISVIGYLVIGACIAALFISDAQQDAFDARRSIDIQQAQAKTIKCVVTALRTDAAQTKTLREAAQQRDDDLENSMRAMKALVQRRVLDGIASDAEVLQAGSQFITQTDRFLAESERVEKAREANQVPKRICGVVIE